MYVQVPVQVVVPEMEEQPLVDVPEIEGHVPHLQVQAYVVSEVVLVLPS